LKNLLIMQCEIYTVQIISVENREFGIFHKKEKDKFNYFN